MAHRQLLTDDERQALLGIPLDSDGLARRFTLSRADQNLVAERRRDANRIGFAVQLALLRYPGIALAQLEQPVGPLVQWLAAQLEIPAAPFVGYAHRPQTMTDHARLLTTILGLRPPGNADLPMMIEAAAQAAWSTNRGQPIAAAVVTVLSHLAPICSWSGRSEFSRSCDLHDADRDASVTKEAAATADSWNVLVVAGSAAEEVAKLIVLTAKAVGRVMLFEATHTSDSSFDPAMVLFKSVIQVDARPVADVAAQRRADCTRVGVMPVGCHPVWHKPGD